MASTSIAAGGYTFTFNDGDIEFIEETILSQAEQTALAATGPMGALLYDYNGPTKTIKIKGYLTEATSTRVAGYTITTILAQKQWLESMINGAQANNEITLTDDYAGQSVLSQSGATPPYLGAFTSTTAYAGQVSFIRRRGHPNRLEFEITLKVGQG